MEKVVRGRKQYQRRAQPCYQQFHLLCYSWQLLCFPSLYICAGNRTFIRAGNLCKRFKANRSKEFVFKTNFLVNCFFLIIIISFIFQVISNTNRRWQGDTNKSLAGALSPININIIHLQEYNCMILFCCSVHLISWFDGKVDSSWPLTWFLVFPDFPNSRFF